MVDTIYIEVGVFKRVKYRGKFVPGYYMDEEGFIY